MIEEVQANLYKIEIPLPNNPLKAINSYVIKNSERNLIIDTGWNQDECMNAMQAGLRRLGVDVRETDFFITHLHSDHLGLVSNLATKTSKIYFNQPDADWMNSGFTLNDLIHFARLNGFPESELEEILHSHPGFKYRLEGDINFHILRENEPFVLETTYSIVLKPLGILRGICAFTNLIRKSSWPGIIFLIELLQTFNYGLMSGIP
jgi:hypothetical protein